MKKEPERIGQIVPQHIKYRKGLNINGYMGGPFADRSGGLIIFTSKNIKEATNTINKDPFIIENLLSDRWIKEWIVE
jgi:uncharacterized protein YciI